MSDSWDGLPNGNFAKWENPGDEIAGDIVGKGIGEDMQGGQVPQIVVRLDDDSEVTITASQAQLRAKLLAAKPNVGDRIKVTFTQSENRSGGKTLKHFEVQVKAGGAKNPTPTAEAVAASGDDF